MKSVFLGLVRLTNKFGFEFVLYSIIIAAIIAVVIALGAMGIALLIDKDPVEYFKNSFMVVGICTFFILILSGC